MNVVGVDAQGTDEEIALQGIEATEAFFCSLNMPTSFAEPGIRPTEDQMRDMARKCIAATGGCQGPAKVLYEADMLAIYQMAAAI